MDRPSNPLARAARVARPVMIGGSLALLADLFLPWFEASVSVPGFAASSRAAGLVVGGWGVAAAVCAFALAAWEAASEPGLRRASYSLVAAVGVLASTVALLLTGRATVSTFTSRITAHETLWPAYVGLVLALVIAAAASAAFAAAWRQRPHTTP